MERTPALFRVAGSIAGWRAGLRRLAVPDERGLSQSTEQALLVAGAVTVGLFIVGAVIAFVKAKLAEQGLTGGP